MTKDPRADLTLREMSRRQAWDCYAAAVLSMTCHPGTTRDNAVKRSMAEIAAMADQLVAERDKRFPDG